jgi:hypothetical protein
MAFLSVEVVVSSPQKRFHHDPNTVQKRCHPNIRIASRSKIQAGWPAPCLNDGADKKRTKRDRALHPDCHLVNDGTDLAQRKPQMRRGPPLHANLKKGEKPWLGNTAPRLKAKSKRRCMNANTEP